jgi:hypothetical protein
MEGHGSVKEKCHGGQCGGGEEYRKSTGTNINKYVDMLHATWDTVNSVGQTEIKYRKFSYKVCDLFGQQNSFAKVLN